MISDNDGSEIIGSLLYVSRSCLMYPQDNGQLTTIQSLSAVRNRSLDVTGLLIVTPTFFAQYLEGGPDALWELMASIRNDPRHSNLVMLDVPLLHRRRFPAWQMSMFGPDAPISQITHPVLAHMDGALPPKQMQEMIEIIDELSWAEAQQRRS